MTWNPRSERERCFASLAHGPYRMGILHLCGGEMRHSPAKGRDACRGALRGAPACSHLRAPGMGAERKVKVLPGPDEGGGPETSAIEVRQEAQMHTRRESTATLLPVVPGHRSCSHAAARAPPGTPHRRHGSRALTAEPRRRTNLPVAAIGAPGRSRTGCREPEPGSGLRPSRLLRDSASRHTPAQLRERVFVMV